MGVQCLPYIVFGRVSYSTPHFPPPSPRRCMFPGFHGTIRAPSGMQLAWLPVANQAEEAAIAVLKELFAKHGPPWCLRATTVRPSSAIIFSRCCTISVWPGSLLPRKPGYNGGCEAGNGSLRKRTAHFALRAGRWTSGCLQAATAQANELSAPRPPRSHAPRGLVRPQPIDSPMRDRFTAATKRHRQEILRERQDKFRLENKNHQRQVQRQAVFRALLALDLLTITRRSIPLPINPKKWAKFS